MSRPGGARSKPKQKRKRTIEQEVPEEEEEELTRPAKGRIVENFPVEERTNQPIPLVNTNMADEVMQPAPVVDPAEFAARNARPPGPAPPIFTLQRSIQRYGYRRRRKRIGIRSMKFLRWMYRNRPRRRRTAAQAAHGRKMAGVFQRAWVAAHARRANRLSSADVKASL